MVDRGFVDHGMYILSTGPGPGQVCLHEAATAHLHAWLARGILNTALQAASCRWSAQRKRQRACCQATAQAAVESPDIVQELAHAYAKTQKPARHNVTYKVAVAEFLKWCILAYECGYAEDDMLLKLTEACDTSSSKLPASQVVGCTEGVCITWLTIEQTGKGNINRWSARALSRLPCRAQKSA